MQNERYKRGVKRPDQETADRIFAILRDEPHIAKAELARRVGVSRQTVGYYLRALRDEVGEVASRSEAVRTRRAENQLELVEQVARAATEIETEIAVVKRLPPGDRRASAVFRGYSTLATYHRLMAELLGEIAPPTTNVYLTRVEHLLTVAVNDQSLTDAERGRVEGPA